MKNFKCWYCKNEILSKDDIDIYTVNNVNRKFHKSECCKDKFIKEKEVRDKIIEEKRIENEKWNELYQYVKKEIMGYRDNQKLSHYIVNKLKNLRNGDIVRRNTAMTNNGYPYDIILNTFKLNKQIIIKNTKGKTFEDEKHRFNYIMIIISDSINDVYNRTLHKEKENEIIKNIDIKSNNRDMKEEYKIKNNKPIINNKVANLLNDLF